MANIMKNTVVPELQPSSADQSTMVVNMNENMAGNDNDSGSASDVNRRRFSIEKEEEKREKTPRLLCSMRFALTILAFFLTCIQYMQRADLSVTIICIVNHTALNGKNMITLSDGISNDLLDYSKRKIQFPNSTHDCDKKLYHGTIIDGPFAWPKLQQAILLSSVLFGIVFTQIPGGYLSIYYGPKRIILLAMLASSIFAILTPISATIGFYFLFFVRFNIGLSQGLLWSALTNLWNSWAPQRERSRIISFANSGSQIGNVVSLLIGGVLCSHRIWDVIFYISGSIGLVWCLFWFILISDTPKGNRFISSKEQEYITKDRYETSLNSKSVKSPPWKKIFTSKPVYALIITHSCSNFGTYLFLTQLPTYMNEILDFDLRSNGLFSSVPYLFFWLFMILSGLGSDKMITSFGFRRVTVRKSLNTIGIIVPMISILCLIFVTCKNQFFGVGLITVILAFTGLSYSGFLVNYNDIGGPFTGIIWGISNTIGTLIGLSASYLVGILTTHQLQSEWRVVFGITAAVYFLGAMVFLFLAQAETQEWAKVSNIKSQDYKKDIENGNNVSASIPDELNQSKVFKMA